MKLPRWWNEHWRFGPSTLWRCSRLPGSNDSEVTWRQPRNKLDDCWKNQGAILQRPGAARAAAILTGIQARVQEQEQTISSSVLERWAATATELSPKHRFAVLCGHPRSGTTLLEQVLDTHPDIITAEETHILHDEAYLPLSQGFPETASVLQVLGAV